MHEIREQTVDCPYCGESIGILIDCSIAEQSYIEDCQVCCRPMEIDVAVEPGSEPVVTVTREDE